MKGSARGFDTSGPAPWRTLRDAKFSYGFIQAGVGLQQNKDFQKSWAAAKACGISRGAYQFLGAADGAAQGRAFLQAVGDDHGEIPPILDLEKPPRCSDECCNEPCGTWTVRVDQWLATVDAKTSRKSVLYYVEPFFAQCLCGTTKWKDRTLFLAAWPKFDFPKKPRLGGFSEWTFYQYEGNVLRYGGVIDLSLFAGDADAFKAWLQSHR